MLLSRLSYGNATEARSSFPSHNTESMKPASAIAAHPCPICLNPITDDAFLDPCFHRFCFHCILQWAEMVFTHPSMEGETHLECPLCKRPSSCIIHNFLLDTFQRHYLFPPSPSSPQQFPLSPAHYQRLYVYKSGFQTSVAQSLHQKLKCTRQFLYISGNANVQQWVQRELQALMQVEHVALITQHVLGILKYYEEKQRVDPCASTLWTDPMLDAVKPFLFENAEIFCVELQTFLYSGFNVKAYDLLVEETLRENTLKHLPTINGLKDVVSECSSQEECKG